MKKMRALFIVMVMTFTFVACGGNAQTEGNKVQIADANEILAKTWAQYKDSVTEELIFPVGGGNAENMVMDEPAKFDTTVETAQDTLMASFCANAEVVAMTDDIATMMNMMMANNFTAAAYHIAETGNVEKAVATLKETTIANQWMCGMPQKLIIVTVGEDYVVSAFGTEQVIDSFKAAITTVYGDAAVISVEENFAQ